MHRPAISWLILGGAVLAPWTATAVPTAPDSSAPVAAPVPALVARPMAAPAAPADDGDLDEKADGTAPARSASREGATGVDTVLSADPGRVGTFRLRLSFFGFSADDFPVKGSSDSFTGTTLGLSATPIAPLELYGAIKNTSNKNAGAYPSLLQTQGDLVLGAKGGFYPLPSLAIGLAFSTQLLGGLGGGLAGSATSYWFRALGTFDAARTGAMPLRFLADVGYYIENGAGAAPKSTQELNKIQEFGLQLARYDRVTMGFALESPFNPYVDPYLEYRVDLPLNVQLTRRADLKDDFNGSAVPMALTPGIRVFPVKDLALDAQVRVGLASKAYLGVPATAPWMFLFAAAYTIDPAPPPPPPPPSAPPPPPEGTVAGHVTTAAGEVLADARVEYLGPAVSAQLTDAAGRFTSYRFPPGKVRVRVKAPKMLPKEAEATIEAGKATALEIKLEPDPAQLLAVLAVQVVDMGGKLIAATVTVGSEPPVEGQSSAEAPWKGEAKPGKYPVTAKAPGYKPRTMDGEFVAGTPGTLRIALEKGGGGGGGGGTHKASKNVILTARLIELKRKVHFADAQARILADSEPLLEEVAETLVAHPEIKKVRIEGHTDDRGEKATNMRLSEDRAKAVQSFLVSHGVASGRLTAKGYGPERPVAPNLTERGRERNRRVELVIVEQDK